MYNNRQLAAHSNALSLSDGPINRSAKPEAEALGSEMDDNVINHSLG